MAIDAKKVLVGAPNQSSTTGAVQYAAIGTTPPTDAKTAWNAGTYCGYVSEDGLTLSANFNTVDIKDWSKSTIRTLLDEFSGEVTFNFVQTDYDSLCAIFGSESVSQSGNKITINIGAHMTAPKVYVFNMKDGEARMRVVLPNAQPVLNGALTFVAGAAINWPVKLTCGADSNGESIYVYVEEAPSSSGIAGA